MLHFGIIGVGYAWVVSYGIGELIVGARHASLFLAVTFIYYSIKRIQKDVKGRVALSGLIFALLNGLNLKS